MSKRGILNIPPTLTRDDKQDRLRVLRVILGLGDYITALDNFQVAKQAQDITQRWLRVAMQVRESAQKALLKLSDE